MSSLLKNSNNKNNSQKTPLPDLLTFQDQNLEANTLFPRTPKSAYLSSQFDDSFEFPFNPDKLADSNIYSTYDEMRHDDQIKAVLSFKKDLIVASGWSIVCEDEEISTFIDRNLREWLDNSFEDILRDMLSHFDYGFSMSEPIFKLKEGKIVIRDIKTRPPHSFKFWLDERGDLEKISQLGDKDEHFFHPKYFIHHVYQPDFLNPYGNSDLRAAHQAWKTKKFFLRFWAIYVERFAQPLVVGTYPSGAVDQAKIDRFLAMLKTMQNSTYLVIPEGMTVDFKEASSSNADIYEKGINLLNTMMARSILMPDLLGLSGERAKGGSFSLGKTQFDIFLAMIKKEQESLARKITMRIIRPLIMANFGDMECEFIFNPFQRDDSLEFMKIWLDATKSKIWTPSDEEINHLREMVNFPISDKIERPEPVDGKGEDGNVPGRTKDKGKEDEEDDEDEAKEDKKEFEHKQDLFFRDQTKFEKKLDFKAIQRTLATADQRLSSGLVSSSKDIYLDFIRQIQDKNLISKFKPFAINDLKPRFQKPMNLQFKRELSILFKEAFNLAQKEIFPMVEKKFQESEELLPDEFLEMIEAESFKLVGDYSVNVTGKIKNTLVQGIKNGVVEDDIVKQMRELGATETVRWLKTVVRTKSTEMFNRGRKSFYDNDPLARQIIAAFEFSAILDSRTSDVCSFLDGKIFEKGELTNNIVPPLHFNCRSILVPVTKFEDFRNEKKFVPPSKEPSLDSLKKRGGNLIFIDKNKKKSFFRDDQSLIVSGSMGNKFGSTEVIPSPWEGRSLAIVRYEISNMSSRDTTVIAVHPTNETDLKFVKRLEMGDIDKQFFKESHWILPMGSGFSINITTDSVPIEWTVEYIIVNDKNQRVG